MACGVSRDESGPRLELRRDQIIPGTSVILIVNDTMRRERMPLLRADDRSLSIEEKIVIAGLVRLKNGDSPVKFGVPPSLSLLEMAYDQGIENFDRAFGLFLDRFSTQRDYPRTAVIVTSDHGEALFTRGYGRHGDGLYEDEVAIPMAARLPGVTADRYRVKTPIGLIDVMPTLCSYLDVRCPESIFGMSLLERLQSLGYLN